MVKEDKNKILTWHISPFSTRSIMVMLEVELPKLTVETFTQSFLLQREVKADRLPWTLFDTTKKCLCLLGLTFHFELLSSENQSCI